MMTTATCSSLILLCLRIFAYGHIAGGLLLAVIYWFPDLYTVLIPALDPTQHAPFNEPTAFWMCILGPTVASWGVLCLMAIDHFVEHCTLRTFSRLMFALAVWAPVDALMCLHHGMRYAAILNTLVVVFFAVLCYRLLKQAAVSAE